MDRSLAVLLLSVLSSPAFCLQCNTCQGEYDCIGERVTCKEPWASCSTSVRKASVSFMDFQTVKKGCARQLFPHESISLTSHMMSLSYQSRFCSEDGCNNGTYFVSHPAPANHMRCHTCATQGPWCPEGARTQISCIGDQDQCINLDITGNMGHLSNMKLRGCANFPRCEDTLSFYSGTRTIHATCCDTPLCNNFTPDLHLQSQAANGLECYSCADGDGTGCSNETISTVQCTGIHNMCLEGIGKSRKGNKDFGIMTFKGCASESMCQSTLLALVQELDDTEVLCCQGHLCNARIVNGIVTESRLATDAPDLSEDDDECAAPSTTASPSGYATRPGCVYEDEEEAGIVPASPGIAPPPKSHVNNETSTVDHDNILASNSTDHKNRTLAGNTRSPSVHAGDVATDERESHDDLFTGYSEVGNDSPTGASASGHHSTGSSSASANLDKNNIGAGTTSSGNHGNVVVLVPIIVPKRNTTVTTTSSSSKATNNKGIVGMSNQDEAEFEECEEEEHNTASGQSPENIVVLGGDHSSAGVFTAEGHGSRSPATSGNPNADNGHIIHSHGITGESFNHDDNAASYPPRPGHPEAGSPGDTHVVASGGENFVAGDHALPVHPVPYVISKENNNSDTSSGNLATTSAHVPADTANHNKDILASGSGVGTSRPKNKIPCKRPGSQSRPGVNLMSSPEAEKRVMGEGLTRNDARHAEHDLPGKTHFPDKTNIYNGAFSLTANLGLFSLTFFLATLLH